MPARDVPAEAIELIKTFEGIPPGVYLCPAGIWTVGWGHAIVDQGVQLKGPENQARAQAMYPNGITRSEAEAMLRADLVPRAATVAGLVKVPVDDGQFGGLIALLYNIGAGNLESSTLLRLLNGGDSRGAAEQFLVWNMARVNGVLTPMAGLTRRRRAERALYLGEDWRAAGAAGPVTRGRAVPFEVLPVPESPEPAAPAAPARKSPAKKAPAKKVSAKTLPAKAAPAKKAAATPPARTTRSKATPPAPPAKRPAPRKAR